MGTVLCILFKKRYLKIQVSDIQNYINKSGSLTKLNSRINIKQNKTGATFVVTKYIFTGLLRFLNLFLVTFIIAFVGCSFA